MNQLKGIPIVQADRTCDGCTACCEGWASGVAHGHMFYPGRKCHYVSDWGCTIYEDRPEQPCKTFKCLWLTDSRIPMWLKPNKTFALLVQENIKGISYVTIKEMGCKLDSSVLSWVVLAIQNKDMTNVRYELDGGWNFLGTKEFIDMMQGKMAAGSVHNKQQL